ncbi:hypothetical protein [Aestuariivirga sp.]|uniref:hypothetical protein n=1 Tax=Aestuariivirga sp. TaxID=2650926 RepID=UPI0025C6C2D9|nr:hypothetical protein [Aestuariivirga sp.]MCA3556236.1 hypothetical protein [Aestuariivirga sp.]
MPETTLCQPGAAPDAATKLRTRAHLRPTCRITATASPMREERHPLSMALARATATGTAPRQLPVATA